MEIQLPVHAMLDKRGYLILKDTCKADYNLVLRLFKKKEEWEKRKGKESFLQIRLSLLYQKRTYKQNATVWVLVTAIFESMEGRRPTEEEKYALYLDLLELYADKVPNKLSGGLRPVHIAASNSLEGARFIDGLLYHLATMCDLDMDTQATVIEVMQAWEAWRGTLDNDPLDYSDSGCTELLPLGAWREKHPYSQVSGRGGNIERAHIVSRGSDTGDIEKTWNWVALLREEHEQQHQIGWDAFLQIYPHLWGRVERARRHAGKLGIGSKAVEDTPKDLAIQALED
jgi:hypothetical protein